MAILMSIPTISPVNPVAAVFPFTFVICLSLLKEALEDRARYLSDIELNASRCCKYEDGGWKKFEWRDVYVGDIIKVTKEEFFPADLILIGSSFEDGIAFIQTSSLDGEKNLKPRMSFKETQPLVGRGEIMRIVGSMNLGAPDPDLYNATGTISIGGDSKLNIETK